MADLPRLKEELLQAARVADPTERLLEAAAIIAEALADLELESGRRVLVLSLEDMLLWRLREWVYWHHASGFHQEWEVGEIGQAIEEQSTQRANDES
jgi:hypothetical protein